MIFNMFIKAIQIEDKQLHNLHNSKVTRNEVQ